MPILARKFVGIGHSTNVFGYWSVQQVWVRIATCLNKVKHLFGVPLISEVFLNDDLSSLDARQGVLHGINGGQVYRSPGPPPVVADPAPDWWRWRRWRLRLPPQACQVVQGSTGSHNAGRTTRLMLEPHIQAREAPLPNSKRPFDRVLRFYVGLVVPG